jgi:ClpP class serine protease
MSKQLASTVISGLNNQPVLLAPAYADTLADNLRMMLTSNAREENDESDSNRSQMLAAYGLIDSDHGKSFAYVDGMAFIPITGILVNRFNWSWSFLTGYNFIRSQMQAALADPDVELIVYDVNSGGGQVAGCFELANDIYASRAIKPSLAVVDAFCYSAAYALASSATKVIVTPSGGVGSIGAMAMHIDYSKVMEDWGLKITFIYSGDHKIDGNGYQALPAKVKAAIQEDVDFSRDEFVGLVARNRNLEYQAVFDTEADTYRPSEGLELGLIDAVKPPIEAILSFYKELSGSQTNQEITMSTTKQPDTNAPNAESAAALSEDEKTAQAKAQAEAQAQAATEARTAERARISAITGCDEAKDKTTLANHLALNTDMTVEAAKGILSASPAHATVAAPTASALDTAMAATGGGADIKAGEDEAGGEHTSASRASEILAAQNLATGSKHKLVH